MSIFFFNLSCVRNRGAWPPWPRFPWLIRFDARPDEPARLRFRAATTTRSFRARKTMSREFIISAGKRQDQNRNARLRPPHHAHMPLNAGHYGAPRRRERTLAEAGARSAPPLSGLTSVTFPRLSVRKSSQQPLIQRRTFQRCPSSEGRPVFFRCVARTLPESPPATSPKSPSSLDSARRHSPRRK